MSVNPDDKKRPTLDDSFREYFGLHAAKAAADRQAEHGVQDSIKELAQIVSMFYKELRGHGLPKKLCYGAALTLLQNLTDSSKQR